jgi:hypothetical protein
MARTECTRSLSIDVEFRLAAPILIQPVREIMADMKIELSTLVHMSREEDGTSGPISREETLAIRTLYLHEKDLFWRQR